MPGSTRIKPTKPSTPSALIRHGFRKLEADTLAKPRQVIGVWGGSKTGKTHFGYTAPAPIAHMLLDIGGEEGPADAFIGHKDIWLAEYRMDPDERDDAKQCEKAWKEFTAAYKELLRSDEIKTIIWDQATDLWELCRLAYFMPKFGRIDKVEAFHYGKPKLEFKELIFLAQARDKNLVLIFKEKKNFTTNILELHGPVDVVDYAVSTMLRLSRDKKGARDYRAEFQFCRKNPDLEGMELVNEMIDFKTVAAMVTGTEESEWE